MNLLGLCDQKTWGTKAILLSVSAMVVLMSVLGLKQELSKDAHVTAQDIKPEKIHTQIQVASAKELGLIFNDYDYTLNLKEHSGDMAVPRLELVSLPTDLAKIGMGEKKTLFLRTHLPLIMRANEKILQDRERLIALNDMQESGFQLRRQDKVWMAELAKRYGLTRVDMDELKRRVDVIPPSLALGQAVVESGWGVSSAARRGNSTFGMMRRSSNKVITYDSLQACVDHYVLNLNRHAAYREMRVIRAELRQSQDHICSLKMADGLRQYSTRGHAYVRDVKHMIHSHGLKRFDGSYFHGTRVLADQNIYS